MAFRFSLEAALRLRRSLEKREELRLTTILRELVLLQEELESSRQANLNSGRRLATAMTAGITGAELRFESACATARTRWQETLQQNIAELDQKRLSQQLVLHRFRQQREILESLRLRQFELYRQTQARREQQQMDDLFLLIRAMSRG